MAYLMFHFTNIYNDAGHNMRTDGEEYRQWAFSVLGLCMYYKMDQLK